MKKCYNSSEYFFFFNVYPNCKSTIRFNQFSNGREEKKNFENLYILKMNMELANLFIFYYMYIFKDRTVQPTALNLFFFFLLQSQEKEFITRLYSYSLNQYVTMQNKTHERKREKIKKSYRKGKSN